MSSTEVQAKAKAAALWCRHATEATWGYLLLPHDHVRAALASVKSQTNHISYPTYTKS